MAQMTTSLRMSHPEAGSNLLRGRAAAATRRAAPRAPCAQAAADFSPDRLAFAMRRQVADAHEAEASRKARSAPTGSAASAASAVPPRKASRREARARAAAEAAAAEAAARRHSEAAQAKLRERTAALDAATLASALRLQLTQSGTFDETEHFVASDSSHAGAHTHSDGHTSAHTSGGVGMRAAAAPAAFFQDGTLLYTADRLEAVEDILTA